GLFGYGEQSRLGDFAQNSIETRACARASGGQTNFPPDVKERFRGREEATKVVPAREAMKVAPGRATARFEEAAMKAAPGRAAARFEEAAMKAAPGRATARFEEAAMKAAPGRAMVRFEGAAMKVFRRFATAVRLGESPAAIREALRSARRAAA